MDRSTTLKRPEPNKTAFQVLARLPEIRPQDLHALSKLELFAVVAEHWPKCSSEARVYLLSCEDRFIRSEARAQSRAFSAEGSVLGMPRNIGHVSESASKAFDLHV